jgi:hypothetical protein
MFMIDELEKMQTWSILRSFHEVRLQAPNESSTEALSGLGRTIAQEVSRRLPTAAARVQNRVWSCGIL